MIGFLTMSWLPNSNTPIPLTSPNLFFASYKPDLVLSLNLSDCSKSPDKKNFELKPIRVNKSLICAGVAAESADVGAALKLT